MVNRSSKRSILTRWHTTMWGAIGCIFCWVVVPSARDQRSGSPSTLAFLSVPTIAAESIRSDTSEQIKPQMLTLCMPQPMQMPPTDAGSWKHLKTESSPPQRSASAIKRQIETAKHDTDTAVVAVNRFAENPDKNADINIEQKNVRYLGTNSPGESVNDPHVKFGLDQEEAGKKPRWALRFVIPFGN